MNAPELFGVAVRTIGLMVLLGAVSAVLVNPIVGGGYAFVGLCLLVGANGIVRICYGPKP